MLRRVPLLDRISLAVTVIELALPMARWAGPKVRTYISEKLERRRFLAWVLLHGDTHPLAQSYLSLAASLNSQVNPTTLGLVNSSEGHLRFAEIETELIRHYRTETSRLRLERENQKKVGLIVRAARKRRLPRLR
jgi:hypothetical protein